MVVSISVGTRVYLNEGTLVNHIEDTRVKINVETRVYRIFV